jgi:putative SOS response-associated peptidase YedK
MDRTGGERPSSLHSRTRGPRFYRLTLNAPPHNLRPRYNVCPTDTIDAIVFEQGVRSLVPMRWGLVPRWWSKPLKEIKLATFNARAETVTTKPFFRDAFRRTRCLIPVSGYYEWQDTPGGKQPWYFTAGDGSPALTVAGLWDEWENPETGQPLKSCTMIITEPNDFVAEVHDRMPVLLEERQFEPWLTPRIEEAPTPRPAGLDGCLCPLAEKMNRRSRRADRGAFQERSKLLIESSRPARTPFPRRLITPR